MLTLTSLYRIRRLKYFNSPKAPKAEHLLQKSTIFQTIALYSSAVQGLALRVPQARGLRRLHALESNWSLESEMDVDCILHLFQSPAVDKLQLRIGAAVYF